MRLHRYSGGKDRQGARTTPTKQPSAGEVNLIQDFMSRRGAERGRDIEVNEPDCIGKFIFEVWLSDSEHPAYLIKFRHGDGRITIFGDINSLNQRVTNGIKRSGAIWVITDRYLATKDLGFPLSIEPNEDGSRTWVWEKISARFGG